MKQCVHVLHEPVVEGFGNPVVLRCIVSCESSLGALRLKEVREFSSCVFSSPVRVQAFDVNAMLSLRPCSKAFVRIECLVLGAENQDLGVAGVIISECHIILASP
jgi:hypothetical protein